MKKNQSDQKKQAMFVAQEHGNDFPYFFPDLGDFPVLEDFGLAGSSLSLAVHFPEA
jgi:hypothetical protein